ncbi:hypothetical protein N1851_031000 [Merluccius polli]|uniref:Tyr recombinase domain-containing protein n=1 Tax=Merluccius polli TaxID=89951 RepID=A0AA47NPM4_MERPO|nr:hypothetical protein N1851_031000 [Merluccius polli]
MDKVCPESSDLSTGSLFARAAAAAGLPPLSSPPKASALDRDPGSQRQALLPVYLDFVTRLQKSWAHPKEATAARSALSILEGAAEHGLDGVSKVGTTFALLAGAPPTSNRATRHPNKKCRTNDGLVAKAYQSIAMASRLANTNALLLVYLESLIRDLESKGSADHLPEMIKVVDTVIQGASSQARVLGNSMAQLNMAWRHVWLSQSGLSDVDKAAVLEAAITPGDVFGPKAETALDEAQKYKSKWRVFRDWCRVKNKDPLICHIAVILSFLQHLFVLGRAESTIRGYLAAVSTVHDKCEGLSPGAHPLASQFLRGVRWRRPPQKHLLPPWDLQVVLGALCLPPFEPLSSIDLRLLCWKTLFLFSRPNGFRDRMVQFLPNPAFQPKVLPKMFVSKPLVLEAFHPPPHTSTEAEKLHNLCPVRALRSLRTSDSLFVSYGGTTLGRAVSKQRLAHWIVDLIDLMYEHVGVDPPSRLVAYSTRGIATTWALLRGAPLEEVLAAAGWSSSLTFARFYRLNLASSAVPSSVLGAAARN